MDSDDKTNALNSNPASGVGGSPWDEPLPETEKKNAAKIVGSLEADSNDAPEKDEKPVPFNIPKEIDEQVGKKVDAASVAANDQVKAEPPNIPPAKEPVINSDNNPLKEDSKSADLAQSALPHIEPVAPPTNPLIDPAGKPVGEEVRPESQTPPASPPKPIVPSKPPKKKGGVLGIFRKKPAVPAVGSLPPASKPSTPLAPSVAPLTSPAQNQSMIPPAPAKKVPDTSAGILGPQFAKPSKPSFFKKPGFVITSCIILLFAALTFLTEAGILSVGIEKVYGIVGLESLWGGLGRNPERALPIAIANTKSHPNFKIKGSVSLTVNKTIKSDVTSPLVVMVNLPFALKDENVGNTISGVLTQYEDYYSTDSPSVSSPTTDTATGTATDTTGSTAPASTDSTSSSSSFLGDQSQYPGYTAEETTIKEMNFDFEGASNSESVSSDITVKKLVGAEGKISLINSGNDLYVKTSSDIKFDDKADASKWLNYKVSTLESENNSVSKLFSAKPDQNFSIIGTRVANEKVEGVRCYNYRLDKLEIGGILDDLGIKSEMIQKIDGNVWLGVADHLVHRIRIVIIPSISSSVTRAEIDLTMYGFDVENDISVPSLSDKIDVSNNSDSNAVAQEPVAISAPSLPQAEQNDFTRVADLAETKSALEGYKEKTGGYPIASSLLKLNIAGNAVEQALTPTYISKLSVDPKDSEGWFYGYTSNGKTFKLSARFENLADKEITKVGDVYLHYVYND